MPSKAPRFICLSRTIALSGVVALAAALPIGAQNSVPPTAREALPRFL